MFPVEHPTLPPMQKKRKIPGKMFPVEHFRPQNRSKTTQNAKNTAEVFLLDHTCGIITSKRAPAHPGRQFKMILQGGCANG